MRHIIEFPGKKPPKIHETAFIDPTATVIGEVEVSEKASIWMGAIVRADDGAIVISRGVSILENCLIEHAPVVIGEYAIISHCAIVHGAKIDEEAIIGIGAILLDGAHIGRGAVVGAASLVPPGMEIPPYKLAMGIPAKVKRNLTKKEIKNFRNMSFKLIEKATIYRQIRHCE